jgi:hypothetical protein
MWRDRIVTSGVGFLLAAFFTPISKGADPGVTIASTVVAEPVNGIATATPYGQKTPLDEAQGKGQKQPS